MNEFERRDWEREENTAPPGGQPEKLGPSEPWPRQDAAPAEVSPVDSVPADPAPAEVPPADFAPVDIPPAEIPSVDSAPADAPPVDSVPMDPAPADVPPADPAQVPQPGPAAGMETPAPDTQTAAQAEAAPESRPFAAGPGAPAPGPQASQPGPAPGAPQGSFYQGTGGGYYAPPQRSQPGTWQGPYHNYQNYQQPQQPVGQPPYGPGGWQQPYNAPRTTGWQQPAWGYGPATTGWNQNPWQAGGYRPQGGPQGGEQVPGQWQGAPAPGNTPPPKKKRRVLKGLLIFLGVVAAIAVVTMAGYGIYAAASGDNPLASPGENFLPPISHGGSAPEIDLHGKPGTGSDAYDAPDGGLSNSEIFQKVSPSVVLIVAGEGNFYGEQALGSGIIMTEDGYIATNAHLVRDASSFEVILAEGDSYKAQLAGFDNNNDLAVLKIDAENLPAAEFGDSALTQVGERVCVIGCPLDVTFRNTLTVGHVSALDRSLRVEGRTINFIQTDAAINPGNSGGPLINAFGQVIGISSAKIVLPEYEGMCFAIPISDAMPILRELIANGKVTGRPVLGITAAPVKATEAEYYEIPLGLWVSTISPGADIGAKGVREGDIITHVDGEPVYTVDACSRVLSKYKPGDTVPVTVFRRDSVIEDTTFTVDVVLQSS